VLWLAGHRVNLAGSGRGRHLPVQVPAALQAAELRGLLAQGIGLRPQPRAGFSRPVGPEGQTRRCGSPFLPHC
jgi:hypothetical protein